MTGNFSGEMRAWSGMNQTTARMTHQHHLPCCSDSDEGWTERGLEKRAGGGLTGEVAEGAGGGTGNGARRRRACKGYSASDGRRGMQDMCCPEKKGRLKQSY